MRFSLRGSRRPEHGAARLREGDVLVRLVDSAGNEWTGRRRVGGVTVDGTEVKVVFEGGPDAVALHITDQVTVEAEEAVEPS